MNHMPLLYLEGAFPKPRLRSLLEHFATVEDPREASKVRFPLAEVLLLGVGQRLQLRRLRRDRRMRRDPPGLPAWLLRVPLRHSRSRLAARADEPHRSSAVPGLFHR